jgi:hypothetical protein
MPRGYSRLTVKPDAQRGGSGRSRFFRPLGEGFWSDLTWALATLSGAALGALLLGFDGLLGALIGVTAVVIVRGVSRRAHDR